MLRKLFMILIAGLFILEITGLSFAQTDTQGQTGGVTQAAPEEIINAGNEVCPVSGEKIGEGMGPVTYEYEGKIYNFCCEMCIDEFKKDPQEYIKKVEEELKTESKQETQEEPGQSMHEGMHEGRHH